MNSEQNTKDPLATSLAADTVGSDATKDEICITACTKKILSFAMVKSITGILKKNKKISVAGRLWIECDNSRFFGPGPLELLERIDNTGSINQAAKAMKMSYKKAWEIISTLNEQSAKPLVETQTGGTRGGGSVISAEAKELIVYYSQLRERFKNFLEKETEKMEF